MTYSDECCYCSGSLTGAIEYYLGIHRYVEVSDQNPDISSHTLEQNLSVCHLDKTAEDSVVQIVANSGEYLVVNIVKKC